MSRIQLLDNATIDKIAAGEVVERPSSVVKELVENAIDAGATSVTIEIKEGGISLIRITDNGRGIEADQVREAFLRHATSKIQRATDLEHIQSLGFRGEALSSISAVAQVEMMTKTKDALLGVRYLVEGGKEISFSEIGVPNGTTLVVKNLFFNTPARRKFLKTAVTEGGYIADLCEHLAMSKPTVSFRFLVNNQVKFHTSGNGDVREIIYRIYGKDFIREIVPIEHQAEGIRITGYLGKPTLNRSNRNFETCFLNGRYVKSSFLHKAIEEGYRSYLMQHKFPFAVLYFSMDTEKVDVNVHPTKMDIRISDSQKYYDIIVNAIETTLRRQEMIPDMEQVENYQKVPKPEAVERSLVPEPFEQKRLESLETTNKASENPQADPFSDYMQPKTPANPPREAEAVREEAVYQTSSSRQENIEKEHSVIREKNDIQAEQINLFEEKILKQENEDKFEILGQIFKTYWLVSYEDKLLFVDQHAAHEKVKYEKLRKDMKQNTLVCQLLHPSLVLNLTQKEEAVLEEYGIYFEKMGFLWEEFGSHCVAIRQMPVELYGKSEKEFFEEILDELVENGCKGTPEVIQEKLASMACKSAVKGNQSMKAAEMKALLTQLFELENPYHCPHGRPTIISMSKTDLEKKFKRIV